MRFYTLRRAWTSLLVVGVPVAFLALAWAAFMGGRATVAALAFVYLLLVACGRAQAIKRERDERPYRAERVAHQVARIRSTLPGTEEFDAEVVELDAGLAELDTRLAELDTNVVKLGIPKAELVPRSGTDRPAEERERLRLRAV